MEMRHYALGLALLSLVSNATAADLEKGKQEFATRCSSCHGVMGHGDGPVGKALPPGTLPNLAKGPFKFATDVVKTKELIQKGGAAVGLNAMMPPAPSIGAPELEALAEYVMSLRSS